MEIFPTGSSDQVDALSQGVNLGGGLTKQQKILITVFVIALVVTGFILYLGFFSKSSSTPPEELLAPGMMSMGEEADVVVATGGESQVFDLEGISLDFSIFDNEVFKGLEEFGSPMDLSGEIGRDNPFIPY